MIVWQGWDKAPWQVNFISSIPWLRWGCAGAQHHCRHWERGWCSLDTAAWSSSSTLTGKGRELQNTALSAGVQQLLWGSWGLRGVVAGWTLTQDMGKEELWFQGVSVLAAVLPWHSLLCLSASPCSSCQALSWVLVWFFFCISSCKRDVRKTICSPKISSGADLLCFLYQIGSAWAGAVGCWAVLCSCLLVWCTEISLITSFLSWIIFGVHSTCVKWVLEMFVWWKKHLLFLCFLPFRSFKCSYPHHLTGSGNRFEVCSLVNSWK